MVVSYSQLCKIREIVNYYDLEGYMEIGAPPNEYYDIVDKIVAEIDQPSEDHIKRIILDTFGWLIDMLNSEEEFLKKLDNMSVEISNILTK